jgi:hypothetical protein
MATTADDELRDFLADVAQGYGATARTSTEDLVFQKTPAGFDPAAVADRARELR